MILTFLCAGAALGGTKHIKTTATGSGTGTEASPWTIPQMNAWLEQGDTALIHGGTYHELIYLENSDAFTSDWFTVKGKPGDSVVIDGKYNNGGFRPYSIMGIGYNPMTATYHKQRYIRVEGIHFRYQYANSLGEQEDAMFLTISGPGNENVANFDFELAADHVVVSGCTFIDTRDQTNTEFFTQEGKNISGILLQNGHEVTITNNYFYGCRFAVFHTNFINLPQGVTIADNVILNTRQNGINLQQPFLRADSVSLAEIAIIRNIIHRVWMEDGIQLEHMVGDEGYPRMRGLYIIDNDIRWPGENCIDLKGWLGPELVVSGNILVGAQGDDNGIWRTYASPYPVHDKLSPSAFSFGADVSTSLGIIRFNAGWANYNWLTSHQGFRTYNNTILSNNTTWEGDATINGVGYDYEPAWNEPPKVIASFFKKRAGCFVNNIVVAHNGANVSIYQTYTADTLHIDNNLYRDSAGTGARMRNKGPWPNYVMTYYNTKAEWQAFLSNGSAYPNFTGDDAHSVWADPGFATAPLVLGSLDSATFELSAGSAARGKAAPLAIVTVQEDQGNAIIVDNAYSFWAGSTNRGIVGDSIIWGGVSGYDGGARRITAINGKTITVSGTPIFADVGDSVWLWRRGVKVQDIGAVQFGESAPDTTPPPPPPDTLDVDTVTVNWKDVLHPVQVSSNSHVKMVNIQRVSTELVLYNPSWRTITWDDTIHWLTAAPPSNPGPIAWYTFIRGEGFKVYGAMTAPVTGEQAPVYFNSLLGEPSSNSALWGILSMKVDSSSLWRIDTTGLGDGVGKKLTIINGIVVARNDSLGTGGGEGGFDGQDADSIRGRPVSPYRPAARRQLIFDPDSGDAGEYIHAYTATLDSSGQAVADTTGGAVEAVVADGGTYHLKTLWHLPLWGGTLTGGLNGTWVNMSEWMGATAAYIGSFNSYGNMNVWNKAGTDYVLWLLRNTSYSEVGWDMSRLTSLAMASERKTWNLNYGTPLIGKMHALPFVVQSNMLSWKDASTTEYWDGDSWETWSVGAGYWKAAADNRSTTVVGVDATHKSVRISYDIGNPWNYVSAMVVEQTYGTSGPKQYGYIIEGDDNSSFTSPETLVQDTVTTGTEIVGVPFSGTGYQYIRLTFNFNISGADWVNIAEIKLLSHRPGDQGGDGIGSWLPFSWDYERNLTLYGKVDGKYLSRIDSADVVPIAHMDSTWLAYYGTRGVTPPIWFPKTFVIDSVLVAVVGTGSDAITVDVRFGPDFSTSTNGTAVITSPSSVTQAGTWTRAAPNNATIPANNSLWLRVTAKTGSPYRAAVQLKGRWIKG